jgi:hypothetical protein
MTTVSEEEIGLIFRILRGIEEKKTVLNTWPEIPCETVTSP